jgi:malate/lactate dehydrogenase
MPTNLVMNKNKNVSGQESNLQAQDKYVGVASHIVAGIERILGVDLTSDKQQELEDHIMQLLLDEFSPEEMTEDRVFRWIETRIQKLDTQ